MIEIMETINICLRHDCINFAVSGKVYCDKHKCLKFNCDNISIPRGKYCETHTTRRNRPLNRLTETFNLYDADKQSEILINRLLREEQENEYLTSMEKDIEILRQKQEEKDNETKFENKVKKLREYFEISLSHYKPCEVITFKFLLPNNKSVVQSFLKSSHLRDIHDFVMISLYDIFKVEIKFNLILYPKRIIDLKDDIKSISTLDISGNNVLCFVCVEEESIV